MQNLSIRKAEEKDVDEVRFLFRDTIKTVNAKDYTAPQIEKWSSVHQATHVFAKKIQTQEFYVAHNEQKIIGFASITKRGLLDLFYVHKDYQKMGVGQNLMSQIEKRALEIKRKKIISDVSITAKPFFEKTGFVKTGNTIKEVDGIVFENTIMEKLI